jgi:probable phosphoglycerate mutase
MPGIGLAEQGRQEAIRAAQSLARASVTTIYVSPVQRTVATAAIIGEILGVTPQCTEALTEIDFGTWTGLSFDELRSDPAWDRWNQARSHHGPPGGETMLQVQARVAEWLSYVIRHHQDETIVAVSHADVIKAALSYSLGLSLDHHHRFEISPGSMSVVVGAEWGMKVHSINETPA